VTFSLAPALQRPCLAGVDVKTAASRLGHSNPSQVLKTYSDFIRSVDKAAAERLEGMLGS